MARVIAPINVMRHYSNTILSEKSQDWIKLHSSVLSASAGRRRGGLGGDTGFDAARNWYSSAIICARSSRDLASSNRCEYCRSIAARWAIKSASLTATISRPWYVSPKLKMWCVSSAFRVGRRDKRPRFGRDIFVYPSANLT